MKTRIDDCSISIKMLRKDARALATFINLADEYIRGVWVHFDAIRNDSMAKEAKTSLVIARKVQEVIEQSVKEIEDEHDNK